MNTFHRGLVTRQTSLEARLRQRLRSRTVEDARVRARQAHGKLRRFVNISFRKHDVVAALALRRGECNRCGACCELVFKCPFLKKAFRRFQHLWHLREPAQRLPPLPD